MLKWIRNKITKFDPRFEKSIKKVLINEGGVSNHKEDPGGLTGYGISLRFLKDVEVDINGDGLVDGKDIFSLTENDAKAIYFDFWWNKYQMDKIENDELAYKILDFSINMGTSQAIKLLQKAINMCTPRNIIVVDGIIGKNTISRSNEINPFLLLKNYRYVACNFYRQLCLNNPNFNKFINGWLTRANS